MPLDMHESALFARAVACFKDRRYSQVEQICQEILARNKKAVEVLELLSETMIRNQRLPDSVPYLERAVNLEPKAARFRVMLGRSLMTLGKYPQAIAAYEKALKLDPKNDYCVALLADCFQKKGDPDKARPLLQPYIEAGTEDSIMAGIWATIELEAGHPKNAADIIVKHVNRGPVSYGMFFTLGKAYEKLGDVDKAFQAYEWANTANSNVFNLEQYISHLEEVLEVFSVENLKRLPRSRNRSQMPLFVSGRPRSGTTLVETILNAHPKVHGGGEMKVIRGILTSMSFEIGSMAQYPRCIFDAGQDDIEGFAKRYLDQIQLLGRGLPRFIDKSMGLNFNLGLIQLMLPCARAIWVRRNAVDNCFACYTEDLVHNHIYAQNLRHLGVTYWFYEKSMRHWQSVLDLPILEINYEELVDNQEEWTRKIIDFCGLEWNDACLRFYDTKKFAARTSSVPTLSLNQVRKPIYKTSVGRAEKFKKHLQPLFDALAEGEAMVKGSIPLPQRAAPVQMTEEIAASLE